MEKELYIPPCCIDKKLPKLLRDNMGHMVPFYSQGDWSVERLWDATSHMVSNVVQSSDPAHAIEHTGGKVRMLLILPCLDRHIMETILRYKQHHWFDRLTIICHTSSLTVAQHKDYECQLSSIAPESLVSVHLGKRAAAQQSMWLRWDDKTLQTLFVSGPMFTTKIGNPTFAAYTASFIDASHKQDGDDSSSLTPRSTLVSMVTDVWRDIIDSDI